MMDITGNSALPATPAQPTFQQLSSLGVNSGTSPMTFISNSEIDAKKAEAEKKKQDETVKPILNNLATYIDNCFSLAKSAKQDVEKKLLDLQRQRDGEYSQEKLEMIQKNGEPEVFMRLTDTKCIGLESWLNDILGVGKKALVEPTPKPDLPEDVISSVVERTMEEVKKQAMELGAPPDLETTFNLAKVMRDSMERHFQRSAKDAATLMSVEIEDILVEGNFYKTLAEFIHDMSTFKTAIMKMSLREVEELSEWKKDKDGKTYPVRAKHKKWQFDRTSPLDWYPAPKASNIKDNFCLEKVYYTRKSLSSLIGNETYNQVAIKKLLTDFARTGTTQPTPIDTERLTVEGKNTGIIGSQVKDVDNYEGLEFYGSVQGTMLKEYGLEIAEEELLNEFDCWCIKIHGEVIKAEINSDLWRRKPYFYTSCEKRIGNVWGFSIAEKMTDIQNICNGTVRALMANVAVSSGPQGMVNMEAFAASEDLTSIYPRKIWQYRDPTGQLGKPIDFFAPPLYAAELMGIYGKFKDEADDITGIPRYAYGNQDMGGAASTARGLSMLMGSATKGIKSIVKNISDDVITEITDFLYEYLMINSDREDIKGDLRPASKGPLSIAAKEELNAARQSFLALTQNDIDMQIIGIQGRAALLREISKGLDMDETEIVPSQEKIDLMKEIEQMKAKIAEQSAMIAQQAQDMQTQAMMNAPPGQQPGPEQVQQGPPA